MDKALYITEFTTVDEAIDFANEYWPNQIPVVIQAMRDEDKVLDAIDEDKNWLLIIGVCDICKAEGVTFMPACGYAEGISGVECFECGNMSMYPREAEDGEES